ncbi:MAG: hypothetical protein AABX12_01665 [Nanoarchaeota archaeon]
MFWDKKKKDNRLPDLPYNASIPLRYPIVSAPKDDLDEESEIHELPAFPDSPMRSGFSQSAIKEAVAQEEISEELPEFPGKMKDRPENNYKLVEIEEWKPDARLSTSPPARSESRDSKPIFVRVDKYQIALSALDSVKGKLSEIEELLKQIRDVKAREDQELSSWETEMETIKARIQTVMTELFDKTDY